MTTTYEIQSRGGVKTHVAFNEAGENLGCIVQFPKTRTCVAKLQVFKLPVPRVVTQDSPAEELEFVAHTDTLRQAKAIIG